MLQLSDPSHACTARLDPSLVDAAKLVLCDLDGCLVSQGEAFPDARGFLQGCGDRLWIVSNNSTHRADEMHRALAGLSLDVPDGRILLAGEQVLEHLQVQRPGATLALFASPSLTARAAELGFVLETDRPEIALLCRDPGFSLARLDALARAVQQGAELWVSNTDTSHPGLAGQPIAETGALLAALREMLPGLRYRSIGKPETFLAELALEATGLAARDAVFVGDNPETDGAAAAALDIPFLLLQRDEVRT